MTPRVAVEPIGLRSGLLDLLIAEGQAMTQAASPTDGRANAAAARAHYVKIQALGALLDDIGWRAGQRELFQLDIVKHGWAAVSALQAFVERQEHIIIDEVAREDPEIAGDAMGRRADVLLVLGLIDEARRQAGIAVTAPTP